MLSLVHQSLNLKRSEECNELILAGCVFDATLISVNISISYLRWSNLRLKPNNEHKCKLNMLKKRTKCARLKCKSSDIVLNLDNKQAYFRYCTWVKRWGAKVRLLSLRCIKILFDTCLRCIKSNLAIAVNGGLKTFLSRSISGRYTEVVKERGDDTLLFSCHARGATLFPPLYQMSLGWIELTSHSRLSFLKNSSFSNLLLWSGTTRGILNAIWSILLIVFV